MRCVTHLAAQPSAEFNLHSALLMGERERERGRDGERERGIERDE